MVRNSTGKIAPGLDIRGDGGYVVAPPSVHPSGRAYEWLDFDAVIASAPAWLLQKVITQQRRNNAAPAAEIGILPEGTRNDGLTRLAGALRRKGGSQEHIEVELLAANTRRCCPPLPDNEVRKIAASVAKYPAGGPDPLECAWTASESGTHSSGYARFLALAHHLQLARPGLPIALPLKRIGELMDRDWTQIRRWRQRAVSEGWLQPVACYVPHRRAAQYLYVQVPQ